MYVFSKYDIIHARGGIYMKKESIFKRISAWYKKQKEKELKKVKDKVLDEYYQKKYAHKEVIYPNELIEHEAVERFVYHQLQE